MLAILDAGPLYAAIDTSDQWHDICSNLISSPQFEIVVPVLVIAEVAYLVQQRLGGIAEAAFAKSLVELRIDPPLGDWDRISEITLQYADFPLGAVDASVVALAERLDAEVVMTLDQRHFRAVRPRHRESLALLP